MPGPKRPVAQRHIASQIGAGDGRRDIEIQIRLAARTLAHWRRRTIAGTTDDRQFDFVIGLQCRSVEAHGETLLILVGIEDVNRSFDDSGRWHFGLRLADAQRQFTGCTEQLAVTHDGVSRCNFSVEIGRYKLFFHGKFHRTARRMRGQVGEITCAAITA
ncbi:hypothetical protein PS624_05975 [Pseudomonas fluorescens]|uniref:Uncharacterized protein n=1 Tax=Pseudomonas fluorescens TaxID=294 RepID=A0A5E6Y495_PSEFL|nr:hypothetical protein PS624_05975 [Pseudomonas fluorescens]